MIIFIMHEHKDKYNLIYDYLSKYTPNNNYKSTGSEYFLQLDINNISAYYDFIQIMEYEGINGVGNTSTICTIFIHKGQYLFHLKLLNKKMIDLALKICDDNKKVMCGKDFGEIYMPNIETNDIIDPIENYRCIEGIIQIFFEDKDDYQYLIINEININKFNTQVANVLKLFNIIK